MVKRRTRKKKKLEDKKKGIDWTSAVFAIFIVVIIAGIIYYAFNKIKTVPEETLQTAMNQDTVKNEQEKQPEVKKEELEERILQIEVLNGCGVRGISARIAEFMRKKGFDVVTVDNYREAGQINFNIKNTFIIDRRGNQKNAKKVADALGIDYDYIKQEVSPDLMLDATIILGHDYKQLKYFSE